ncbi:histidine kinase [Spongiactinospora sp. TRM90649]|uniref:sensor histidine kinase n=1 Tax=Spongiactinospora sp. TRM90649 TaxID=3031114 RepID=UPI0023F94C41|nr:histidine kinase [Spongiactinospora sp. TRM90649]MDF5756100.1 histidine kinase [Spongiactinospora sp. TRM90649]
MVRHHARAFARAVLLLLTAVAEALMVLVSVVALVLAIGQGMVVIFSPLVRTQRRLTGLARRRALAWAGVRIEAPYEPPPPPPVPDAEGWYRADRVLYRTPRVPAMNMRYRWLFADPATWRDMMFLVADTVVAGVLGLVPVLMVGYGLALPSPWRPDSPPGVDPLAVPLGLALVAGGLLLAPVVVRGYAHWCRWLLGSTRRARLTQAMGRLVRSRSDALDAQTAELRRIERDLHDGAQARLVAVGMTLGAAHGLVRTDPAAARTLLGKAREESAAALGEIRRVVRGIHPPVLAERGLGDAVRALALDSPLTVDVVVDLDVRPTAPVESAAYFAVSELLAEAARQGRAERVRIDVSHRWSALRITFVDDDGTSPPAPEVLDGIERRLGVFDGVVAVSGDMITIELPHALAHTTAHAPPGMPPMKTFLVVLGWSIGWLPLFPQGIVAGVMKVVAPEQRSWFLALHLPEVLQWPFIILMIMLGVLLYGMAAAMPLLHSRERWMATPSPGRPWFWGW